MTTAPQFQPPFNLYSHFHSQPQEAGYRDWPSNHLPIFPADIEYFTMSEAPLNPAGRQQPIRQNGQVPRMTASHQPNSHLTNYSPPVMNAHGTYSDNMSWNSNLIPTVTPAINHHSHAQHTYADNAHASYSWTCDATAFNTPVDNSPARSTYTSHYPSPSTSSHTLSPYSNTPTTLPHPLESPVTSVDVSHSPSYPSSRVSSPGMTPLRSPDAKSLALASVASGLTPERQQFTHRQQLQMFREVVASNPIGTFGQFIPQQMYKPHTNSDWKRYVEEVETDAPIYFTTAQPSECGIPLSDALHSRVKRLQRREETVFEGRGPSVSIRIEWPGYRPWSRQIPTKDFKSPPGPITIAKLVKNIAKCVQRFIDERQHQAMDEEADSRWRIGQGHITIEDLVLVSLHHVSLGSWQPQLRLRYPFPRH